MTSDIVPHLSFRRKRCLARSLLAHACRHINLELYKAVKLDEWMLVSEVKAGRGRRALVFVARVRYAGGDNEPSGL